MVEEAEMSSGHVHIPVPVPAYEYLSLHQHYHNFHSWEALHPLTVAMVSPLTLSRYLHWN